MLPCLSIVCHAVVDVRFIEIAWRCIQQGVNVLLGDESIFLDHWFKEFTACILHYFPHLVDSYTSCDAKFLNCSSALFITMFRLPFKIFPSDGSRLPCRHDFLG